VTPSSRRAAATLAAFLALVAAARRGAADDDRPGTGRLVLAGLGMAVPTYFVGVLVHEGSHAIAAELAGADVVELRLLPGVNPRDGHFYFGYVRAVGLSGRAARSWFLVAPKLVDLALLGSYAALALTDRLPGEPYAHLALNVLATGFWVDFSKDVPAFWSTSDVVKLYDLAGARSELQRLPLRLVHAALSAAAAYVIIREYRDLFRDRGGDDGSLPAALLVPLAAARF